MKQNNRGVLTAIDHNGFTCAHIAAMKVRNSLKILYHKYNFKNSETTINVVEYFSLLSASVCGKGNDNEPLQEFILQSPAPIDTAVKLSALYRFAVICQYINED
uniref:ANK_REP_REGION domain-containing protein n=1 Tax=Heterorhabditis bacteriophora TaxID=37862 RepID=A0A1I7WWT2_HETBA